MRRHWRLGVNLALLGVLLWLLATLTLRELSPWLTGAAAITLVAAMGWRWRRGPTAPAAAPAPSAPTTTPPSPTDRAR